MKKQKIRNLKIEIKKDFKRFFKEEGGFMAKENILKIGVGTIAALGMFSSAARADTAPTCDGQTTHLNDNTVQWIDSGGGVKQLVPSHSHHLAHCSY